MTDTLEDLLRTLGRQLDLEKDDGLLHGAHLECQPLELVSVVVMACGKTAPPSQLVSAAATAGYLHCPLCENTDRCSLCGTKLGGLIT